MASLSAARTSRMLNFFTEGLPTLSNCSAFKDSWPKQGVCSDNAIECIMPEATIDDPRTFECVCGDGWTGKADFISSDKEDCHIKSGAVEIVIWCWLISGVLSAFLLFLWQYKNFYEMFKMAIKRKPVVRKTLAYLTMAGDGLLLASGCTYRLATGNRFCFDTVATLFLSAIVSCYLMGTYFFLATWVKMAIASTTSSKIEAATKANSICRTVKYQYCFTQLFQFIFWIALAQIPEEVSASRDILAKLANLCTMASATFGCACLIRCGKMLSKAIREAGDDEKMRRLASSMMNMVIGASCVVATIVVGIGLLTFVPILITYQCYILPLTFTFANIVPFFVCAMLEKCNFLADWRKRFPLSKVSPADAKNKAKKQAETIVSKASAVSVVETDNNDGNEARMNL